MAFCTNLIDTTSQSLATAALQILLPRNPLPPHTTSFFFAAAAVAGADIFTKCGIGVFGFLGYAQVFVEQLQKDV